MTYAVRPPVVLIWAIANILVESEPLRAPCATLSSDLSLPDNYKRMHIDSLNVIDKFFQRLHYC